MGLYAIVGEQIYAKYKFPLKCSHQLFHSKTEVGLPRETSFPCVRIFQDTFLPPHTLSGYVWKLHWQSSKSAFNHDV